MKMNILSASKSFFGKKNSEKAPFVPSVGTCLRKNGEIYIFAQSMLRGIASVESEPFIAKSINDNPSDIGESVLHAKSGSSDYFERENYRNFVPPYFKMAGVKSYSQFAKNTKRVTINFYPEYIEFHPERNERGVWLGMEEAKSVIPSDASPADIGKQLLRSFEDAVA